MAKCLCEINVKIDIDIEKLKKYTLQRYDIDIDTEIGGEDYKLEIIKNDNGEWCKFEDITNMVNHIIKARIIE